MKITAKNKALTAALKQIAPLLKGYHETNILANVLITAKVGEVLIEAWDGETRIAVQVEADVTYEGRACANAAKLLKALSALPAGDAVTLLEDGGPGLAVQADTLTMRVQMGDIAAFCEDFPSREELPESRWILTPGTLAGLLEPVAYCQSSDPSRMNLNGVYLESVDGMLRATATDGHRLSMTQLAPGLTDGGTLGILPTSAAAALLRCAKAAYPAVGVRLALGADGKILTLGGGFYLAAQPVQDAYPDYRQILKRPGQELGFDRKELIRRVERIAKMIPTGWAVTFYRDPIDTLYLLGTSADGTRIRDTIDEPGTHAVAFACRPRYLIDALKHLDSEQVTIWHGDEYTPLHVLPVGLPEGVTERVQIVMPMRRDEEAKP